MKTIKLLKFKNSKLHLTLLRNEKRQEETALNSLVFQLHIYPAYTTCICGLRLADLNLVLGHSYLIPQCHSTTVTSKLTYPIIKTCSVDGRNQKNDWVIHDNIYTHSVFCSPHRGSMITNCFSVSCVFKNIPQLNKKSQIDMKWN